MASLRVVYTTSDKLPELTLSPGQLYFIEDTRNIQFVNNDGELVNYTSVVSLATETGRAALSHPYPAMYWIRDTKTLWHYDLTDGWDQVTEPAKEQIIFEDRNQFPPVGEEDVIYVSDTTMYRYLDGEYKVISGGGSGSLDWLPINE